mmetsp:Transcript_32104/g.87961  ORF Transcript_32104/g.87961 Transcript_32104/m.87961 type:complete len:264 (-) Transcript_32104:170-961(-)
MPEPVMPDPFNRGSMNDGWGGFYRAKQEPGRPHLRTYGSVAEKFSENFKLTEPREPDHKIMVPGPGVSNTWGIGGTHPTGRMHVLPNPALEFHASTKRHLEPKETGHFGSAEQMGRKHHVYDTAGLDMRQTRSDSYSLDTMLQRKARVPEEMRSEARTIHRMAPPGLKGYMGAEYSNDYFRYGASVPAVLMRPSREDKAVAELKAAAARHAALHHRKTFKQKRVEADLAEQVGLVAGLNLDYEYLDDDEDRPVEEAPTEEPAE